MLRNCGALGGRRAQCKLFDFRPAKSYLDETADTTVRQRADDLYRHSKVGYDSKGRKLSRLSTRGICPGRRQVPVHCRGRRGSR